MANYEKFSNPKPYRVLFFVSEYDNSSDPTQGNFKF